VFEWKCKLLLEDKKTCCHKYKLYDNLPIHRNIGMLRKRLIYHRGFKTVPDTITEINRGNENIAINITGTEMSN